MVAQIIDGKVFAASVREKVSEHVAKLKSKHEVIPGLAVVLVGEDPASQVYVRSKGKQTVEVGMKSVEHKLDMDTSETDLLELIKQLNEDDSIHGILVQLPLPKHLNEDLVINSIDPTKDVDGFHVSNVGLLGTGQKSMIPCTPLGPILDGRGMIPRTPQDPELVEFTPIRLQAGLYKIMIHRSWNGSRLVDQLRIHLLSDGDA